MSIVTQTAPKVARVRRNKVTGQLDLFAPVAQAMIPVPALPAVPSTRKRKYPTNARYVFLTDGTLSLCRCSRCEVFKSPEEFRKERYSKHGIATFCLICSREYNRDRYHREGGKTSRNQHLRETYGITLEQYNLMLSSQGGVCAICQTFNLTKIGKSFRSMHVDHCHKTGRIRGILCSRCNSGLGWFKDNAETLSRASQYLLKQT